MKTINNLCERLLLLYLDEKLRQMRTSFHKIPSEEWTRILKTVNNYLLTVESTFSILKEKENLRIISEEEKKELDSICEKTELLFEKLDKILLEIRHIALNNSMNTCRFSIHSQENNQTFDLRVKDGKMINELLKVSKN